MAIVQISQITNRKGLQIDLPQLAGAELGWSTDERRLFIGNGTLVDGAPVIGNTEILTEFSQIPVPTPIPLVVVLANNQTLPDTIFVADTTTFTATYTIIRDNIYRTGTITVVSHTGAGPLTYNDDYIENADTGITITVVQLGVNISVLYTSTNSGYTATFNYLLTALA